MNGAFPRSESGRTYEVTDARGHFLANAALGSRKDARDAVVAAIDRWVWYAGWTDKLSAVLGGGNSVAGPYVNLGVPEPTGVVAVSSRRSALPCSGW